MEKTLFGRDFLIIRNNNLHQQRKIYLEYYKILKNSGYGIEILKKEINKGIIKIEKENIDDITQDENEVDMLLEKIKRNRVLPCTLKDIIDDEVKKV